MKSRSVKKGWRKKLEVKNAVYFTLFNLHPYNDLQIYQMTCIGKATGHYIATVASAMLRYYS